MENQIITLENGTLTEQARNQIVELEKTIAQLQELQKQYKEALLQAMIEQDIKSIKLESIEITRVDATYRESFDSKAFKEEHRDLYDEYVKTSNVKASIRVKVL